MGALEEIWSDLMNMAIAFWKICLIPVMLLLILFLGSLLYSFLEKLEKDKKQY